MGIHSRAPPPHPLTHSLCVLIYLPARYLRARAPELLVEQDVLGLEVAVEHDALTARGVGRVQVEQCTDGLSQDAQQLAPRKRRERQAQPKAAEVLRVGLARPQPVSETAATHEREHKARVLLERVAQERQQVRVRAAAQQAHLAPVEEEASASVSASVSA